MQLYEWILLRWIDSLDLPVSDLIAYLITIDTNLNHLLKVPQYPRNCYYFFCPSGGKYSEGDRK